MIGNLLSTAIRVATLPIDVAESAADIVLGGGDGSRESKNIGGCTILSELRDGICKGIEDALEGR